MVFYVYIIESLKDETYQHNNGESDYTSKKIPWKLVYVEEYTSKREALIRERNLKKADRQRILALINSSRNLLRKLG